jgi:phosphoribosyl 1,2-cyclic phosphodiesterase
VRSRRHRRHSALLITRDSARIMIDCGADWLKAFRKLAPTAIILTHGHADHAFGLAEGAPCPVFATNETWALIDKFPIDIRRMVLPRKRFRVGGVQFEAFPVEHSLRAPAVGYRIAADRATLFYVPDVAAIPDQDAALRRVAFYIGDGATVTRSMVRVRDHTLMGHAPIAAQLKWCGEENVARAIFTHCGSGIVRSDGRKIAAQVRRLGSAQGVEACMAHDGLKLVPSG